MITVCGVYCEKECQAYGGECAGCHQLKGKVSWTKYIDKDVCPIYACVMEKGYQTCLECELMPCKIWLVETKNPSLSDKDYTAELQNRIKNLYEMAKEK